MKNVNKKMQNPYEIYLPHATLAFGSCFKWASNTASLIWSHILSVCQRRKKMRKKRFYQKRKAALTKVQSKMSSNLLYS